MNKWQRITFGIALSVIISLAGFAPAQIHVAPAPTGVDTGDGRNPANPVATITYALSQANTGEEIRVTGGTYNESISTMGNVLLTGDWLSDFSARNDPIDSSRTIIQGDGSDRVVLWQVDSSLSESIEIDGFTIRDGDASISAVKPGVGGGIAAIGGGRLILKNTVVQNNTARSTFDSTNNLAFGFGGGVYVEQQFFGDNITVSNNISTSAEPTQPVFPPAGEARGGGIYFVFQPNADQTADYDLVNSDISLNTGSTAVTSGGSASNTARGGGICVMVDNLGLPVTTRSSLRGPAPSSTIIAFDANGNIIAENKARTGDNGEAEGGGLNIDLTDSIGVTPTNPAANISIIGNDLRLNIADSSGPGLLIFGSESIGGGIYIKGSNGDDNITIDDNNITGNTATTGGSFAGIGGGIAIVGNGGNDTVTINDTIIDGNLAADDTIDGRAGGLELRNVFITITNSDVINNTALQNPFAAFPPEGAGGGIFNSVEAAENGRLEIFNTCFSNNLASDGTDNTLTKRGNDIFTRDGRTSPDDNRLIHVTSFNNLDVTGTSGFFIDNGSFNIQNTIITGQATGIDNNLGTGMIDSVVHNMTAGGAEFLNDPNGGVTSQNNIITGDPLFTLPPDNLQIASNSPARDQGVVILEVTEDRFGNPRGTANGGDANPDIGYNEFTAPSFQADFGDAPDSYPVTLAQDGARHLVPPNPGQDAWFGLIPPDYEPDAMTSIDALGDGTDEDGFVRITGQIEALLCTPPNPMSRIILPVDATSELELSVGAPGIINAWIDFNGDGVWSNGSPEQIATDLSVTTAGAVSIMVPVPAVTTTDDTFARFRIAPETGLGPTGETTGGEVEDYRVLLSQKIDISLTSSVSTRKLGETDQMVFTVSVTNSASSANAGPIAIVLDEKYQVMGTDVFIGTFTRLTAVPEVGEVNGNTWSIPEIPAGATRKVDITYRVSSFSGGASAGGVGTFGARINCTFDQNANPSASTEQKVVVFLGDPPSLGELLNALLNEDNRRRGTDPSNFDTNNDGKIDVADLVLLVISNEPL